MTVPTIHMNGTSRDALLEQACKAGHAARALVDALGEMAPNGRDYYPQGPAAIQAAILEHGVRMSKAKEIMDDLDAYAEAIAEME